MPAPVAEGTRGHTRADAAPWSKGAFRGQPSWAAIEPSPCVFWDTAEPTSGAPASWRSPKSEAPSRVTLRASLTHYGEPIACGYLEGTHTWLLVVPAAVELQEDGLVSPLGRQRSRGRGGGGSLSSPVAPRRPSLAESAQDDWSLFPARGLS